VHVPVGSQHLHRVPNDARRHAVLACQLVSGQWVTVLVLTGDDLVAEDASELDVLR
jgi:hypothetical protein